MGERTATLAKSRKFFLSGGEYAGEVTRFDMVCDYDPFSQESMRLLGEVDNWLKEKKDQPNSAWHDVEFDFIGVTAGHPRLGCRQPERYAIGSASTWPWPC